MKIDESNTRADKAFERLRSLYEIKAPPVIIEMMLVGFIDAYFGSFWRFTKFVLKSKLADIKISLIEKLPFALKPKSYQEMLRQIHE